MHFIRACLLALMCLTVTAAGAQDVPAPRTPAAARPNIVYILCDDLGIGDVRAFNPDRCKIATPNLDKLAAEGVRFTDSHTASSVCTPTRYNLLTGRYNWRTRLQKGVLQGNSPPLIPADRLTVPALLRQHGYDTAMIGKWHLGLAMDERRWADPITDGPTNHGFDQFFGISASLDMPPFAYIDGDRFPELPTTRKTWIRAGAASPNFEAVDVLPTLTKKSVEYIAGRAKADKPFFHYIPLASPHTPIVPSPQWAGKSGLGAYGDFVMQTDDAVGQIGGAIRAAGIDDNTMVIFTSDNGCSPAAKVKELEAQGHFPSAGFRGYKSDIWEGGHRVPFIVRWPGVAKAGATSAQTICLGDLMATCAQIVGTKLPDNAGEDSVSFLPALRDPTMAKSLRDSLIHHSMDGYFAIRQGKWKLAACRGSGGWSAPREAAAERLELPNTQLYDLDADPGETTNLSGKHPDVTLRLMGMLMNQIATGRSTPGARQANDVSIDVVKKPRAVGGE